MPVVAPAKKPVPKAAPVAAKKPAVAPKAAPKAAEKKLTPVESAAKIKQLLSELATSDDQGEKRKIRQKLRSLGHRGGLPKEPKAPKAKGAPAKGKAKPIRTIEDDEPDAEEEQGEDD